MILLAIIDGAGPDVPVEDQDAETKNRTNGNEPERQIVQENEQQNPTKTAETAKEPVQTSTSPKCAFSRTVIPIDLKRFTASSVTSVECASLWKNAFALPSQGRPPVPTARATQNPDRSSGQALVGHRKNGLGRGGSKRETDETEDNEPAVSPHKMIDVHQTY
jgi:hypothetical protein